LKVYSHTSRQDSSNGVKWRIFTRHSMK